MLNDPAFTLRRIDDLITEARSDELSPAEKAGLWAAIRLLCDDVEKHLREKHAEDGYAFEKISKVRFHMAAALGFDIDNGHDSQAHRVWAMGDLDSLRSVIAG